MRLTVFDPLLSDGNLFTHTSVEIAIPNYRLVCCRDNMSAYRRLSSIRPATLLGLEGLAMLADFLRAAS